MSLKRAFKAVFSDPDWLKKSGLGMLGMLVPYIGPVVVMGYGIEYMRGVAWRNEDRLPEWRALERYLKTGFGGFVVSLVYMLPIFLLIGGLTTVWVIFMAMSNAPEQVVVPVAILIALMSIPVSLVWSALVQGGLMRFAAFNKIGDGLRIGDVLSSISANRGAFFAALWRVLVLNLSLSGILLLGYGVVFGGVLAASLTGSDAAALAVLPIMYCGQFVLMIAAAAVGVIVQLISYHVWGQYMAIAYPTPQFETANTPEDPVAQYGAGHSVLPMAPGQQTPPVTAEPPASE